VEAVFHEEAEPHFRAAWEQFDASGQECLKRLARGKPINKQQQFAREQLIRRGTVTSDNSKDRLGSRAFRDFVLETTNAPTGSDGLAARLSGLFGWRRGR
jgi:hypothetical protein